MADSMSKIEMFKGDKGDKMTYSDMSEQELADMAQRTSELVKDGQEGSQGLTGQDGKHGKDGKNGKDGVDGYTPLKGVDYLTKEDIEDVSNKAAMSAESQLMPVIEQETKGEMLVKKLEALPLEKRLDYLKLQNVPTYDLTQFPNYDAVSQMISTSVKRGGISVIDEGSIVGTYHNINFIGATITNGNGQVNVEFSGGGSSDNIYTADGTLTGNRTVDQNNHKLSLMSGDLQLGDYPNTRDNGGVTHTLGTSTQSAGMTAGGGATFSGTYTGGAGSGYVVTIGFSKGSPTGDWSWTLNGGSPTTVTGITTGSPYLLSDGISVTFNGAGTGYGDPATLSAPIDSVGVVPENILYTDINGNVLSALLDDVIPTVNTLYTADGTLAGDRIVQQAGNDLTIRSLGSGAFSNIYQTEQENHLQSQNVAGDYIATIETKIETPVFGSDRATATMTGANTTSGAESYVKADSIGAAYISGTLGVLVRTPAVHAATATVGQVLALANVPGGVEFIDAPSDKSEYIIVGASDETTALTTGTAKTTFRIPWTGTITGVRASVTTAPTDAVLTVDINKTGTGTILSTKITIDATEKTSVTAATAPVISTAGVTDDDEYTIDIDTVGSTVAGTGLKITILGTRS